jgi:hypothetical protein
MLLVVVMVVHFFKYTVAQKKFPPKFFYTPWPNFFLYVRRAAERSEAPAVNRVCWSRFQRSAFIYSVLVCRTQITFIRHLCISFFEVTVQPCRVPLSCTRLLNQTTVFGTIVTVARGRKSQQALICHLRYSCLRALLFCIPTAPPPT